MKEDEIRRLIKIVEESNIGELEITRWGKTIKISKFPHNSHTIAPNSTNPIYQIPAYQQPVAATPPVEEEKPVETKAEAETKKLTEIKAPMVGTFYRAPAPDADPYVDVDQPIKKGQVLCIIEAMKLMNEIESEMDGRIVEILVENGQPVEYNQPLFRIDAG
ncbi:MAG: acetyl-CoA carboxylase biotin carboxyl carrier protein [bacterium]